MKFVAPRLNRVVLGFTRLILSPLLRARHVVQVEYLERDLERLRALRGERVALTPNHPSSTDPAILYHLSKAVDMPFHYLCAREVFNRTYGCWGWVIRRVGAYSIVRGTADRRSFMMTRQLITRPAAKLVVFPEGEAYSQNDSLLPFHSGVVQLLFWAQEDLLREGDQRPIYILPVAIKYKFVEEMRPAIGAALARLETAVGLPTGTGDDPYTRLRRIGETVVEKLEADYDLSKGGPADLASRIAALKEAIIDRVARALHVQPRAGTLPDRMRQLINTLNRVTHEGPTHPCLYDARLWEDHSRRVAPLLSDLKRLANWIAVYDGYVAARPTPERMADTIRRLEVEVLGRTRCVGKQHCLARLAEPVSIASWHERYAANKRETVEQLTLQLESTVQSLLDAMA